MATSETALLVRHGNVVDELAGIRLAASPVLATVGGDPDRAPVTGDYHVGCARRRHREEIVWESHSGDALTAIQPGLVTGRDQEHEEREENCGRLQRGPVSAPD